MPNQAESSFFSIPISGSSSSDVLSFISNQQTRWIVTANPEILLYARKDKGYRDAILKADLRIADGFGLVLLACLFGKKLHRITGVDLAEATIKLAAEKNWSVALVGGGDTPGTAQKAFDALKKFYPSLRGFAHDGGVIANDGTGDVVDDETIQQLIQESPDIVLVGFGHPKQERWIARNLPNLPSVKTIIGVGGTFDYWAGNVKRAPGWMRAIGIEWLFRLMVEPKRWKRIWNAVAVFPVMAFTLGNKKTNGDARR